jgi:hypothetical protein
MALKTMKVHELCQMFSSVAPLPAAQRTEMLNDIKANGIKIPILVNHKKDTILDGLTRWKIAHELGLKTVPMDVFKGKDEEIAGEILSRNIFRRHMNGDQRASLISKVRGPQLEEEAAKRIKAGVKASGSFEGGKKGSTVAKLAKEAGVTEHKMKQAEKVRKAGGLDEVIAGKSTLRKKSKSIPAKKRKMTKVVSFADQVFASWQRWINKYAPPQRREVMAMVAVWCGEKK